jgi:hypothetical protein
MAGAFQVLPSLRSTACGVFIHVIKLPKKNEEISSQQRLPQSESWPHVEGWMTTKINCGAQAHGFFVADRTLTCGKTAHLRVSVLSRYAVFL